MKTLLRAISVMTVLLVASAGGAKDASRRTPVVIAVQKALPSVVNISTEKPVRMRYSDPSRRFRGDLFDEFFRDFFGTPRSGKDYPMRHSLGSGVIIDPRGYILSNYHVIERASRITVTLTDETEYEADFVAGDELNDIAMIKINPDKPLRAVEFAEDEDLMLGETVIALGNPFGLAGTVTVGVLSAKNREAKYGGEVIFRDILQTDAAVNPGSSGGPLLNIDGDLIGVSVAIYREAQNIGFAVPIRRAKELAGLWLSPRIISRMSPGFDVAMVDGEVVVSRIEPSLPAVSVQPGDRILGVGGKEVDDLFEYHKELLSATPGDVIPLDVRKGGGEEGTVEVTMAELPKPSGKELADARLGVVFTESMTGNEPLSLGFGKGLVVSEVRESGPAAEAGLKDGLIVTQINQMEVDSLDDVGMLLEDVKAGDVVVLNVLHLEEQGTFIVAQRTALNLVAE